LEKNKNLALQQEAEHNRSRDSLQKKVKMMEHPLAKKTAKSLETVERSTSSRHFVMLSRGQDNTD